MNKKTINNSTPYKIILGADNVILRDSRVVTLFGEIEEDAVGDFIRSLEILSSESKDPIYVIIKSGGGSVDEGLACINAIQSAQQKGVKIFGHVFGHAQSMAFLILQQCDVRSMSRLSILMAHGITSVSIGDIKNREAENKLLKFLQKNLAELIVSRCNKGKYNVNFWKKVLADQTPQFFTSEEALEMGLVDKVE